MPPSFPSWPPQILLTIDGVTKSVSETATASLLLYMDVKLTCALWLWAVGKRKNCIFPSDEGMFKSIILHAKLLQSCLILCSSMDCSPPGSSVYGILQARILECIAISSSRGSSWPRDGLSGWFFTTSATWEAYDYTRCVKWFFSVKYQQQKKSLL